MEVKAGEYYRTRDGRKAYVAGESPFSSTDTLYRVVGWIDGEQGSTEWTPEGFLLLDEADKRDLVEGWRETLEVWALLDLRGCVAEIGDSKADLMPYPSGCRVIKLREVVE
jgi:hypothetical protein